MCYVLNWKKVLGDPNEGNTAEQSERKNKTIIHRKQVEQQE